MSLMSVAHAAVQISWTDNSEIQINWTDNSDNEEGFVIERRLLTEAGSIQLPKLAPNSITAQDNPPSGKIYCYRVGAFNAEGTTYSAESCVAILPAQIIK